MASSGDNFNRADGDVGTTDWEYHTAGGASGALQISGNKCTTADNVYRLNLFKTFTPTNAQSCSVLIDTISGFWVCNVLVRGNGSVGSLGGYLGQIFSDLSCNILELTADVESTLASGSHTIGAGDTFEVRANGTSLSLHKNGNNTPFLSTTDASHASGKGGVGLFRNGSTILVDNFTIADLGAKRRAGGDPIGNIVCGRLVG